MLVKTAEPRQLPRLVVNLVNRSVDKQKLCGPMHKILQEEEPERLEGSEASNSTSATTARGLHGLVRQMLIWYTLW